MPNDNQNTGPTTQPAAPNVSPQMDIPPLPSSFPVQSVTPPTILTTQSPKKKFGGGRIVATILGILVLVGGVGAGIIAIQQPQFFQQQAAKLNPNDIGNPKARRAAGGGNVGTGGVPVDYGNKPAGGKTCADIGSPKARQECRQNAPVSGNFAVGSVCDASNVGEMDTAGHTCVNGGVGCNGIPGENCQVPHWTTCADAGGNGTPDCNRIIAPGPGDNTTTTTTTTAVTASCQSVTTYNASWTPMTVAQLSTIAPGTTINFCVNGTASDGSTFDKAKFTINGTLQPETTTRRPGSTDFCQSYQIPPGVSSFKVSAQIHHPSLGWSL